MSKHPFVREESKKILVAAVESVENRSAAEVVVAVKPWSGRYWYVDQTLAAVLSFGSLAFMLFSSHVFSLPAILVGTVVVYLVGLGLAWLLRPVRVWFCPGRILDDETKRAAQAWFYAKRLSRTRDRSGILVYVSLLEKRAWALPDLGVTKSLGQDRWNEMAASLQRAIREKGVGPAGVKALAEAIEAMGPDLEKALPRREDDVNELADFAEG